VYLWVAEVRARGSIRIACYSFFVVLSVEKKLTARVYVCESVYVLYMHTKNLHKKVSKQRHYIYVIKAKRH